MPALAYELRYGKDHPAPVVPIDRGFNVAILHIADRLFPTGFDVGPDAPDTLDKLTNHINTTGRMLVSSDNSGRTIFGDAEVNYAFRAWHDFHHYRGSFAFTPEGEAKAAMAQAQDLIELYGGEKAFPWLKLLDAEVNGQARYQELHGRFPTDQVAFDLGYIASPARALNNPNY